MASSKTNLSWCQGYDGGKVWFIADNTVCHTCGNNVKFHTEGAANAVDFRHDLRNLGQLATQQQNHLFAIAESGVLKPRIQVYSYPDMKCVGAPMEGSAELEISALAFSSSEYLYAATGLPDFRLCLWDYSKGRLLARVAMPEVAPVQLLVSPMNWRLSAMLHDSKITVFEVERCQDLFQINSVTHRLPPAESEVGTVQECDAAGAKSRVPTRSSTAGRQRGLLDLPESSVAGLDPEFAAEFEEYRDSAACPERMRGLSLAWSELDRDFYVGCADNCLVRYDDERRAIRVLYRPSTSASPRHPDTIAEEAEDEGEQAQVQTSAASSAKPVCFDHLSLSTRGLYAAGDSVHLVTFAPAGGDFYVRGVQPIETGAADSSASSLSANIRHSKLAIGTCDGGVHLLTLDDAHAGGAAAVPLYRCRSGGFVGSVALPGGSGNLVATVRASGLVQVWDSASGGALLTSLELGVEAASFAGNATANVALIGGCDGSVSAVDFSKPREPRLLCRRQLHQACPVAKIVVDPTGRLFVTAAADGRAFIGWARPSKSFEILGGVSVPGQVQDMSVYGGGGGGGAVQVLALAKLPGQKDPCHVTFFEITDELMKNPSQFYGPNRGLFDDAAVKRQAYRLDASGYGCTLFGGERPRFYTISKSTRQLLLYPLPTAQDEVPEDQILSANVAASPEIFAEDSEMQLKIHLSKLALLVYGCDGHVTVVDLDKNEVAAKVRAHSYTNGGVLSATLSLDGKSLLTTGHDGSLCRFAIKLPDELAARLTDWELAFTSDRMSAVTAENEAATNADDWTAPTGRPERRPSECEDDDGAAEGASATSSAAQAATWLRDQERQALAEEDRKYADKKSELRDRLAEMRTHIKAMVDRNEVESDELERLDPHEFELDLDEQAKFGQETDGEVAGVRKRIGLENLAKKFLAEVIKRECWEEMEVKGRSIVSFSAPLEVSNYPLRPQTKEDLDRLDQAAKRRVIEIQEAKDRRELLDAHSKDQQPLEDVIKSRFNLKTDGEEEEETQEQQDHQDSITLQGSAAERFGILKSMFYSQFELHTREQKINQIVLLQDSIRHIKTGFNKAFSEVYKRKDQEMGKIRERNLRVKKIVSDLGLPSTVSDPNFVAVEKPELLFTVSDSEITVEKYLTPEQRKKLEEERQAEEDRLRKERLDNWRERGLDQMMGGVLEVHKEDELKKDIPKPAFMANKQETEWNEDERKAAEDYERRVRELQEEREKYRKQLEAELKKLQGLTEDNMSAFDQELRQLFSLKVKTQSAVVHEELKIYRLRLALLIEEELSVRELELATLLHKRRSALEELGPMIERSRKLVKTQDEQIQYAKADNEYLEKNFSAFKKEFPDASAAMADALHKMFKKKLPQLKIKAGLGDAPFNPYGNRPTTASRQEGTRQALGQVLREQDDERHMPSGLDAHVWQRFCHLRRSKREKELLVGDMTLALSEFQAFVTKRESEYNQLQADAENLKLLQEQLANQRAQFANNLEVQLLVKQGQVEVDPRDDFIIDFADSLLLSRSVVEDLNSKIKTLGEAKVRFMEEAKDSKKTFRRLEWELRGMRMDAEDLINKLRDVNSFKITREIQRYLSTEDYDGLINSEIQKLDQAIELMKKHHTKMVEMKQARLKELSEVKAGALAAKNERLDSELEDMNVGVNERVHIEETNAEKRDESYAAKKRYEQILQRQRLVDLAKAQAKEVAVLRAEVERLRMRTFPALVHTK